MLFDVPQVLSAAQVAECRAALAQAEWIDGRATVGHLGARAKHNRQLPEGSPVSRKLGATILGALERSPLFITAALPLKVYPPAFNCYESGETYGSHVDGAVREVPGTPHRVRTDLSATLFLTPPEDYDGGELTIEDTYGPRSVKLPAGDMILYPASSVHNVHPVTRGSRLAAFFWVQSMVRDDGQRRTLLELDISIQQLRQVVPDHPSIVQLTNVYHNLLRRWAET